MNHLIHDRPHTTNRYLFERDDRSRLESLCLLYDEGTIQHLDDIGIGPDWRCLEVGAGIGSIARWLGDRVGARGHVVATDIDVRHLDSLGSNVEVRQHDIVRDPLEEGSFDLVHTRAVLMHLPERAKVLKRLAAAVKPGGWLMVEDAIITEPVADPEIPLLSRVIGGFVGALRRAGADPHYGVRLPRALREAGLADVKYRGRFSLAVTGTPGGDLVALSLERAAPEFIAGGLATADEIREALSILRAPGTVCPSILMVAAWGRAGTG
jgi:SAM-dependent methyltransferase